MEQQVWSIQLARQSTLRPRVAVLLPHSAFQEHAAHPLEWSRELSSKGSLDTCISKGHSTFSYAAFTAHVGERVDEIAAYRDVFRDTPLTPPAYGSCRAPWCNLMLLAKAPARALARWLADPL